MTDKQEIVILDDISHCLLRPSMYIGSTKPELQTFWCPENNKMVKKEIEYVPGQFKLFCEVLDNAIDEHVRGFGNRIDVTVNKSDGNIKIKDYARGIPIDKHKEAGIPTPQVVFTQLRSGSNFKNETDRKTVGLNGVGAALATIFSERLCVQIIRDNQEYQQCFSNNLSTIGKPSITKHKSKETGTTVTFKLDSKIFGSCIPPIDLIKKRCIELAYMFPGLEINLEIIPDEFSDKEQYVYKNEDFNDLLKMFSDEFIYVDEKKKGLRLGILLNKVGESFEQYSNVNGADTWRGGTHIDYLKDILTKDLRERIKKEFKIEVSLADISKNMMLVVFLNWNAPQFEGQTKEKLVNDKKDIAVFIDEILTPRKIANLSGELDKIKQATYDAVTAKNDRKLLDEIKSKQKTLDRKRIPKLIECSSKDRSTCSLYITEGDSAITTLASVRNSKTMAGLPLKGKILNVFDCALREVIDNKEIQALVASIGLKFGDSPFKKNSQGKIVGNNLSYGKIIIATDQDMDGYCIRCLLVNFFYKYWPDLFEQGVIQILETPLYEVLDKKTNDAKYFYNKQTYEEWIKDKNLNKYIVSYFKGLGSCGKEAWDYMINKNPNLVKISAVNVEETKKILSMAFGDDSDGRKKWLTD